MAPEPRSEAGGAPAAAFVPQADAERQLVEAILRRDRKAAARFVADYADTVYSYARHRLAPREEAVEDVVQEVFLAALDGLSRYTGASGLRAWLLGIARHKVEDYYRRRLREPELLEPADEGGAVAEGPLLEEAIDRERLEAKTRHVLRLLPETYSVALLWRYWENRSVREMAVATGKTEKAMERLLARARARFRAVWQEV